MSIITNQVTVSTPAMVAMARISQTDAVLAPLPLAELMSLTAVIAAGIVAPKVP